MGSIVFAISIINTITTLLYYIIGGGSGAASTAKAVPSLHSVRLSRTIRTQQNTRRLARITSLRIVFIAIEYIRRARGGSAAILSSRIDYAVL